MTYPGEPVVHAQGDHSATFQAAMEQPEAQRRPKYVIFKTEAFEAFLDALTQDHPPGTSVEYVAQCYMNADIVTDGVVLRKKDIWTADTLDFYANGISQFVQAVKKMNGQAGYNDRFLEEQQRIADYFRQEADDAHANYVPKFPD